MRERVVRAICDPCRSASKVERGVDVPEQAVPHKLIHPVPQDLGPQTPRAEDREPRELGLERADLDARRRAGSQSTYACTQQLHATPARSSRDR